MAVTGDIFGTALSGLTAFQRVMHTSSQNITNSATEGYSRQRVDLAVRNPVHSGTMSIGTGVDVTGVQRIHDEFVNGRILTYTSTYSQDKIIYDYASSLDQLLANEDANLSKSLQSFFNDVQQVSDYPTSLAARQSMITSGDLLVGRFNNLYEQVNIIRNNVNQVLSDSTETLNNLAVAIADVNEAIAITSRDSTFPPNDLLDQRDQLVRDVSELVKVSTIEQDDGSLNVYIGSGQALVLGQTANTVTTVPNKYNPLQQEIAFVIGGTPTVISQYMNGGELGGLLELRDNLVTNTENELGRIAIALSTTFNQQHQDGMDLNGNINQNFFVEPTPFTAAQNLNNAGAAAVTVEITDVSALTTSDYSLTYNGVDYVLRDERYGTNTVIPGGGPFPFDTGFGFTVDISAGALSGDSFLIRPTNQGAANISLELTDARRVAAATPVKSQADITNVGDGVITQPSVTDINNANLQNTVSITFTGPATFDVFDVTLGVPIAVGQPYTPGAAISYNGWATDITETPQTGDVFTVESNVGGVGDNSNALAMMSLQSLGIMEQGTGTYQDVYATMVSNIGSSTRQAEESSSAQEVLLTRAETEQQALSGVNLDEEAAQLIRFQQAYQATARVLTAANEMFQTLLQAFR